MINRLPDEFDVIAVEFGHNPGVANILYYLTGQCAREVHTSTCALIEFDLDKWSEISGDTGKLTYYSSPKDL